MYTTKSKELKLIIIENLLQSKLVIMLNSYSETEICIGINQINN